MTASASSVPRLSVLLPCRNAASTLPAAIRSIEAQTYRDYEVLAVDDGSTDPTPAVLDEWARRDARVRVLSTPARGLVPALQSATAAAGGEILVRMDADDIVHGRRFELQLALLDARRDLAACGTRVRYFPRAAVREGAMRYERWINGLVEPEAIVRDLWVECPIPHPTLMVRAEALAAVGGYRDPGWPEDYDLVLRLWAGGHRLGKVPRVLLLWREGEGRASRTDPRYSPDAFRRCKVHYLRASLLRSRGGELRPVVVWGAGPVGKRFARELHRQGARVVAFIDLDRRKIGQTIHGAPVHAPADAGTWPDALVVGAVGSPGARTEIRAALDSRGRLELRDYVVVA